MKLANTFKQVDQKNNVLTNWIQRTAKKEGFDVDVRLERIYHLKNIAFCEIEKKEIIINSAMPVNVTRTYLWKVALHEIAHLSDDSYSKGHSEVFYKKMKKLKRKYPLWNFTIGVERSK